MSLLDFRTDIPEAESEHYMIKRFTVNEKEASFFNLRLTLDRQGYRAIKAGEYTKLQHKSSMDPLMSDTPAEIRDHLDFILRARDRVLINGLGLGIALDMCLAKEVVQHATVIEICQEVIDLVGPYYHWKYPNRLTIICADALMYKPEKGVRFGAVWHDIWPSICADNLNNMKLLHRRYGGKTDWQGSWCRDECERHNRESRQYERIWA